MEVFLVVYLVVARHRTKIAMAYRRSAVTLRLQFRVGKNTTDRRSAGAIGDIRGSGGPSGKACVLKNI